MNPFLTRVSFVILGSFCLGSLSLAAPAAYAAMGEGQFFLPMQDSPAYLARPSQGYLGVDIRDIDSDRAGALKLKEAKGAEIVTVDHDAPAGKSGLRVHDVILEMNGQAVEGVEQLRRLLRETPSGRTVTFVVSRNGVLTNVSVQLADRATVEQEAWNNHISVPEPPPAMGFNSSTAGSPHGLMGGWSLGKGSALYVGAIMDPVAPQLANYIGVQEGMGLLVKSVDSKSPAATAGLKQNDVVLKINQDTLSTRADWERELRENYGKSVQLTIVRDRKQQVLTMQAGSPKNQKKKSELDWPGFAPSKAEIDALVASAKQEMPNIDSRALAEEVRKSLSGVNPDAIRQQMEEMRQQMPELFTPQQMDQLRREMDRLRQELPAQPMD
ncbi:MAG TPA: PDZ domain-containing protein [Acidisarcina sp.]|nr:PDZ domain-containing protein [Acidisarcina sp.]